MSVSTGQFAKSEETMSKRAFIKTTAAAGLIMAMIGMHRADGGSSDKPNVILIMTDDQGYGDLGCNGNPWLKTPNIDKLASQSVRLDDYHASPYCVPARAALLTGRYADRTGGPQRAGAGLDCPGR